jgi:hypothetical protein
MSKKDQESLKDILVNKEFYGHPDIEAAYQRALGKLTMHFSLLHFLLERMSWTLWGLNDQTGHILTKDLRVSHLAEKLIASADYAVLDKDRTDFRLLMKRIKEAAEKRNDFLHSLWLVKNGEPVFCVSRKRGVLGPGLRRDGVLLDGKDAPSVEEIDALSVNTYNLANEIQRFSATLGVPLG